MKKIAVYTGFMTDAYRERINETAAAAGVGAPNKPPPPGTAGPGAKLVK